jgi:FlaA1/EpsC-like NDP-sugar epimerase
VLGALDEAARAIQTARVDEVLVTIPEARQERLDGVVQAASEARVPLRIVRRHTEFTTPEPVEAI